MSPCFIWNRHYWEYIRNPINMVWRSGWIHNSWSQSQWNLKSSVINRPQFSVNLLFNTYLLNVCYWETLFWALGDKIMATMRDVLPLGPLTKLETVSWNLSVTVVIGIDNCWSALFMYQLSYYVFYLIILFDPHDTPGGIMLFGLLSHFYSWGNWGLERRKNLPEVIKQGSSEARILIFVGLFHF